jgi:hypothetical protein
VLEKDASASWLWFWLASWRVACEYLWCGIDKSLRRASLAFGAKEGFSCFGGMNRVVYCLLEGSS